MPQDAWPLLTFTLLTQMSVGAFCVAELIDLSYSRKFGYANLNPLRHISFLFVFLAAILAGVSSVFHLKNWAHAYHAFNNIRTSWVSKEMVLFFLFIASVTLLALMSWRKIEPYLLQRIIGIAGVFSGMALIYSMAKIYMLPTIPSWDTWTTPGFFYTSVLVLGTLAIVCLYSTKLSISMSASLAGDIRERWGTKTLPALLKLSLFFIVVGIFFTGFFAYRVMTVAEEYGTVSVVMNTEKWVLFSLKILLYVFGWSLLFYDLKKTRQLNEIEEKPLWAVYGAFILIALAEIVGRHLFYVSFFRIGV